MKSNSAASPGARKRHLPIVQTPADADADPTRPRWQWVGFGALATFVVWLPLAAASLALASRAQGNGNSHAGALSPAGTLVVLALGSILALGLAAMAGGFLVGKWGGRGAPVRDAGLAGLTASLVAVGASWASFGFMAGALLVIPLAVAFASLGGWLGRRAA